MNDLIFLIREIWKGSSVTRAFLNLRLNRETLRGKTIDIGGGRNADYIHFMQKSDDVVFETFDIKAGANIDFEKDALPARNDEYDTVLFLNVMEHIYNYAHITREVIRIAKKEEGQIIGFVPFLMWYHPDHSDYFRYTHEALEKIFKEIGVQNVSIDPIARGPFTVACHLILYCFPRLLRVPIFLFFYFIDSLFLLVRPTQGSKYVLGYFFKIHEYA